MPLPGLYPPFVTSVGGGGGTVLTVINGLQVVYATIADYVATYQGVAEYTATYELINEIGSP